MKKTTSETEKLFNNSFVPVDAVPTIRVTRDEPAAMSSQLQAEAEEGLMRGALKYLNDPQKDTPGSYPINDWQRSGQSLEAQVEQVIAGNLATSDPGTGDVDFLEDVMSTACSWILLPPSPQPHRTDSTILQTQSYPLTRSNTSHLGSRSQIRGQNGIRTRTRRFVPPVEPLTELQLLTHGLKMFLLDTLDSMPRLQVSDGLMKIFLWVLKESGAPDVPSLGQLRAVQATLRDLSGIPSKAYTSAQKNLFWMNDIRSTVAHVCCLPLPQFPPALLTFYQDYANPHTRSQIQIYPEMTDGPITEIWHAEKWRKEMDPRLLSPMYADGDRHFYVLEFARLKNGNLVVPVRWLSHKGQVKADAFEVKQLPDGTVSINTEEAILIEASDLRDTYPDLIAKGAVPECGDGK